MSDQIFFDGQRYISAAEASAAAHLSRDYIARLCRENKVRGKRIGKNWYVDKQSLTDFVTEQERVKAERRELLSEERAREYGRTHEAGVEAAVPHPPPQVPEVRRPIPASASEHVLVLSPITKTLAAHALEVQSKLKSKALEHGESAMRFAPSVLASPSGVHEAVVRTLGHTGAHVPVYTLTPFAEFIQKFIALLVAFTMTFGTYALVDPTYARFAMDSLRDTGSSIARSYRDVTGGGITRLAARSQEKMLYAAENPNAALAQVSSASLAFIPESLRSVARSVNSSVDHFVYAIAFPDEITGPYAVAVQGGANVSVEVAPYTRSSKLVAQTIGTSSGVSGAVAANSSGSVADPITIIERRIETERVVAAAGGITEEYLDQKLAALESKLSSRLIGSSAGGGGGYTTINNNYQLIAQSNNIDKLGSVTIESSTITGGTISGTAISDVEITGSSFAGSVAATTLSASATSSLATTTVTGDLTVSGDTTIEGTLTIPGAISISSSTIDLLTNTYATTSVLSAVTASTTNLTWIDATGTNATTTNFFSTNASTTNATSTNIFASVARFTSGFLGNITSYGEIAAPWFNATSTTATSTFAGGILGTRVPTVPHTFASWTIGAADANPFNASLLINPASAAGDANLIAAAVGGSTKFLVDAEGDVFLNNLTSVGSVTLSTTTASTFTVEGDATFGDSITDVTTVNGSLIVTGTTTASTIQGNFGVGTTTPWARISIAGAAGAATPLFSISSTTAGNATSTVFHIDSNGRVGVGTTSPSAVFAVNAPIYVGGQGAAATSTYEGNLHVYGILKVGTSSSYVSNSNISSVGDLTVSNATTTNIYSTTASSTNLYSTNAQFGALSLLGTFTSNGLGIFTNGFISQASSTVAGNFTATGDTSIGNFNMDSTATCGNTFHAFIGPIGTVGGDECAALNVTQQDINGNIIYRFGEANGSWAGEFYANSSSVNLNTKTAVPITFQTQGTERMRVASDGKVGIGTVDPQTNLDVVGNTYIRNTAGNVGSNDGVEIATDSSAPRVSLVQGGRYVGLFSGDAPGNTYLKNVAGGDLMLYGGSGGNVELARLTNGGYFGIGTTSPWKMLSVAGDIIGTNITATGTLAVASLTSGRIPFVTTGGELTDSTALSFDSALSRLTTTYASTTALTVSGGLYTTGASDVPLSGAQIFGINGWWGIRGDLSSRFNIDTYHNGNNQAVFTVDQLGNTSIGTSTSAAQLTVWADSQSDTLLDLVDDASTTVMTVKTAGSVGIGTTSPWAKLAISANNGETNTRIFDISSSTASATTSLFSVENTGNVTANTTGTTARFYNISAANVVSTDLYRDSSGSNMLIYSGVAAAQFGNSNRTRLQFGGQTSSFAALQRSSADSTALALVLADGSLGGSFGIGTSTPFAKFAINANNGETKTRLFEIASSTASATSTLFVVTNSGNIGIGTTTPSSRLTVSSSGSAEPLALFESGTGGASGDSSIRILGGLSANAEEVYLELADRSDVANSFTIGLDDDASKLQFGYGALGTLNGHSQLTLTSGGNMGIGTTSPFAKFSLAGDAYLGGNVTATGTLAVAGATTLSSTLDVSGNTTLANATTTSLFSTTASSTNLFASTAQFGTLSVLGALTQTGLGTFANGFVSQASSTVAGAFTTTGTNVFGGALNITGAITSTATSANTFPYASTTAITSTSNFVNGTTTFAANLGIKNNFFGVGGQWQQGIQTYGSTNVMEFGVNGSSDAFTFGYGTPGSLTRALTILGSGNVGIGTTSPVAKLAVDGDIIGTANSGSYRTWGFPSGYNTTLVLQGASTSGVGGNIELTRDGSVVHDGDTQYFRSADGVTDYMRITSAGKVGIGTTNPGSILEVQGANVAVGQNNGFVQLRSTTAQAADVGASMQLGGMYDGSNALGFAEIAGRKENSTSGNWSGYLQFSTRRFGSTFAERMRIDSLGNVGIGSTTPSAKLVVSGDMFLDGSSRYINFGTAAQGTNGYGFRDNGGTLQIKNSGGSWTDIPTSASGASGTTGQFPYFSADNTLTGTSSIYLATSGNVGIGTTTPTGRLEIDQPTGASAGLRINASGTQNPNFIFSEAGTNKWNFGYDLTNNYFKISESSVADRFAIQDTTGNVGIGTTSPATTLSVSGNGYLTGGLGVGLLNTTAGTLDVLSSINVGSSGSGYKIGGTSLLYASTTNNGTVVGLNSGANLFASTTATHNTVVGSASLNSSSLSGDRNNVLGASALTAITTGSKNQAIGVGSLTSLTTGWDNVAIGDDAGYYDSTGSSNVYIGQSSGRGASGQSQSNNVAVGYRSLYGVTSGGTNTTLGYQAGYTLTSGSYNVILGNNGTSGGVTSGSNNILIGQDVRSGLSATGSNQLNIGNLIFGTGLGSGTTMGTGNIGIGTTTPFTKLEVNDEIISGTYKSTGGNFRLIGGSYGAMLRNDGSNLYLLLTSSGDQYGTWNALRPFTVNVSTGAVTLDSTGAGGASAGGTFTATGDIYSNGTYFYGDSQAIVQFSDEWLRLNPSGHFTSGIYAGTGVLRTDGTLQVGASGATFYAASGGNVGIGTTSPYRKLSVTDTVAAAQASIAYDGTRDTQLQTDSSGDFILNPSGDDVRINDDNLWVCAGGSCPSGTPSGNGNLIVESKLGVGTSSPQGSFEVLTAGGSDAASSKFFTSDTNYAQILLGSVMSGYKAGAIRYINGNGTAASSRLSLFNYGDSETLSVVGGGKVGIGTTSPAQQLGVAGMIFVGANGATGMGTATSTFAGDIKILGKLDVSTIDPPYTIDGVKYATFVPSMTGVKEETTQVIHLDQKDASGKYAYVIDFDKQEKGSDVWLFYQITDFGNDWKSLVVALTPAFDGTVFYKKVPEKNQLIVYADAPGEVSMRLTGNRYDFSKWPNLRADQDGDTAGTHVISSKPLSAPVGANIADTQ